MNNTLISVKNLRMLFPARAGIHLRGSYVHAVDGLNFDIKKGEIFGLVGESGCGKTTCGKLMVRLFPATEGQIIIEDQDIEKLNGTELRKFRKKVQMIFQDPYESMNPRITIFDTVMEPLIIQQEGDLQERETRVREVLRIVDLPDTEDFYNRYPHELSGGQRQRVSIARALVIGPEFVVADEAVSMLDVSIKAGIMNLLLKLRDELGLTIMFITHDLAVARYLCDRIGVMYLGSLVELGPAEKIVHHPRHPYTKALISAVPDVDISTERKRIRLSGQIPTPVDPKDECRFAGRCPKVMDRCRQALPAIKPLPDDPDIQTACYLFDK